MHDDDRPTSTPEQDGWVALTAAVRHALAGRVGDIGAMTPAEMLDFTEAVNSAWWQEFRSQTWDRRVELEHARVTAE